MARVPLRLCFIDLLKTYDSDDRSLPWEVLAGFVVLPRMTAFIRQFHDGMRACVRNENGDCSEEFNVQQGLREGCPITPSLFNIFADFLLVALQWPSEDSDILTDLVHLQEQPMRVGPETAMKYFRRAVWGMLYTDVVCIVSWSPPGLERMATLVDAFDAFGITAYKETRLFAIFFLGDGPSICS